MKVLDLRPFAVRFMTRRWRHREKQGPPGLAARATGRLVDRLTDHRLSSRTIPTGSPWLISVGNLALGGTGKTPVVIALAQELGRRGLRGAVLTRGFGSRLKGPLEVVAENGNAGDEARLMALSLQATGWPVVQARNRLGGLEYLIAERPGLDLVVIEDGHQTSHLGRHLDILILDRWDIRTVESGTSVRPGTGPVFPFGPWRETARGAERASLWVLETDTGPPPEGHGGAAVTGFSRKLRLSDPRRPRDEIAMTGPWAVLSGIARPEAFESHAERLIGTRPVLAVRCGDHADYGPRRVAQIAAAMRESGAGQLVTTSKDWIKIQVYWPDDRPVAVAELEIAWRGNTATLPDLVEERFAVYKAKD